ncbi:maltose acetyltransferase, partial [Vibrio sp. S512-13]
DTQRRLAGDESAEPVKSGNIVWIGGDATLLPGVTIGDEAVFGAGSFIAKAVAPGDRVAGNPACSIKPKN